MGAITLSFGWVKVYSDNMQPIMTFVPVKNSEMDWIEYYAEGKPRGTTLVAGTEPGELNVYHCWCKFVHQMLPVQCI